MLNYDKTMKLGRRLLDKHGLTDWTFDIENLKNAILYGHAQGKDGCGGLRGICQQSRKRVSLHYELKQSEARYVILHEIAHALCPEKRTEHGHKWFMKAVELGVPLPYLVPYLWRLRRP